MEKMSTEQLSKSYEEVNKRFLEYVKKVTELRVKDQFLNCPVRRVFISVPMSGRTQKEVEEDIEEAKNVFLNFFALNDGEEHFEFVNTFIQENALDKVMYDSVWYLGNSIKILSTCDIILFARGASKARGCEVEDHISDAYRIPKIRIYERYKDDRSDFDYTNGHLALFVSKKEVPKPKYMTEEGYKEWREEIDE